MAPIVTSGMPICGLKMLNNSVSGNESRSQTCWQVLIHSDTSRWFWRGVCLRTFSVYIWPSYLTNHKQEEDFLWFFIVEKECVAFWVFKRDLLHHYWIHNPEQQSNQWCVWMSYFPFLWKLLLRQVFEASRLNLEFKSHLLPFYEVFRLSLTADWSF